jgi:hypothetical protein
VSAETAAAALATAVAAACAGIVAWRAWRRPSPVRPAFVAWAIGFGLFAVAAAALTWGAARGWSPPPFRVYYLTGGILVVAYLAVGEMLLVLPGRRVARVAAASMLFLTFAAAAAVLAARVDDAKLDAAGAAPPNDALHGMWATVLAVSLNSAGTLVLLAFTLHSAWRRRDPRPLLVAAGVGVIAVASSATRLGSYEAFALGQAAGVVLILGGLVAPPLRAGRGSSAPARTP